jgi:hypothetical protein
MKKSVLLLMITLITGSALLASSFAAVSAPSVTIPIDTLKNKIKELAVQKVEEPTANKIAPKAIWNMTNFDNGADLTKGIEFSNPFPNPANQQTRINFQLPSENAEARVMLRNLLGSVVKDFKVRGNETRLSINTADLNSGLYFYSVMFENRILFTKKLIVKH